METKNGDRWELRLQMRSESNPGILRAHSWEKPEPASCSWVGGGHLPTAGPRGPCHHPHTHPKHRFPPGSCLAINGVNMLPLNKLIMLLLFDTAITEFCFEAKFGKTLN